MYKIIGADQKEYGPITADQMRQWIVEGRVNAQTLVWSESSGNWKPLTTYPELVGSIPGYVPGAVPPTIQPGIPGYSSPGDRAGALQKVNGPAIGLFVTAGLGILAAIAGIAGNAFGFKMGPAGMGDMSGSPELEPILKMMSGLGVVQGVIHIIFSIVIFIGANKLRKLENYGFSLAVAILAVVPCFSPCCWVGIPIGIWAIVVLNKPEVKSHFDK